MTARRHVLLAKSDPTVRQRFAARLRDDGFEVADADDVLDLLPRLESLIARDAAPEDLVVVSDAHGPGRGGLQVLAMLRRARWRTPVIMLARRGDRAARAEARALGATAVLTERTDVETLRRAVRRALPALAHAA